MKLAIMQPYIFPYIGYFQLINAVDKFIFLDDVNYINKGWINRNRIIVNGDIKYFCIPLEKASQNSLINEIKFAKSNDFFVKFKTTIIQNYKKARYFDNVMPIIDSVFDNYLEKSLSDVSSQSIKMICQYLGINVEFRSSSMMQEKKILKGQDRIIEICIKSGANDYYNLSGGKELYNRETFNKNNINLYFLENRFLEYKQNSKQFYPEVSIIDIVMHNSPQFIMENF